MSEVSPIAGTAAGTGVRAAIAQAARRTGADFDYLMAQARIESSLDPSARAPTSSAAGLYQFTRGTWLETLERHGAEHGLDWAGAAIDGGRVRDPALRARIMALRFDPQASSLMAAELAEDNRAALTGVLGREPDAAELYLAHFLGIGGATQLLSADPGQSAAALLPKAAAANRGIFYAKGAPRTVAGVMDLLRGKVNAAMGSDSHAPSGEGVGGWGLSARQDIAWMDSPHPNPSPNEDGLSAPTPPQRPSMAETLRSTFALANPAQPAPGHIRAAYGRLRSLGL